MSIGGTRFQNRDRCVITYLKWKSGKARGRVFALEEKVTATTELIE